jgi:hypothetical protein
MIESPKWALGYGVWKMPWRLQAKYPNYLNLCSRQQLPRTMKIQPSPADAGMSTQNRDAIDSL